MVDQDHFEPFVNEVWECFPFRAQGQVAYLRTLVGSNIVPVSVDQRRASQRGFKKWTMFQLTPQRMFGRDPRGSIDEPERSW